MASFALSPFPGNTVGRFPSSPSDSDGVRSCRRGDGGGGCNFRRSHPSSFVIICTLERPDNKLTRVSSSISMQSYPHPIPYTFYALASLALTLCKAVAVPSVPGLKRRPRRAKCREGEEEFSPMEVKERGEFRGLLTMQGGEEFAPMEVKKRGEFGSVLRMHGGGEFTPVEVQKRGEFGGVSRVQEGVESTPTELQKRAKFGGILRMQRGGVGKGESSTLMGLLKRGELGGILRMQGGEESSLMESQKMGEFGGVLRMQGGGLGMALLSTTAIAKDQLSPVLATLLANPTFVSGAVAWAVAQVLKVFTTFFVERRWDFKMLLSSGGMPSSHSALCAALTMSVALSHGVGDALFPVCLGFSLIVMYDATGVRRHAGMQAEVLNLIVEDLFKGHPISEKKLKELLGHTPLQVAAGAFLGVLVGYFCSIGNSVIPGMGV